MKQYTRMIPQLWNWPPDWYKKRRLQIDLLQSQTINICHAPMIKHLITYKSWEKRNVHMNVRSKMGQNSATVSESKNSVVDPSKNINFSTKYFKNLINANHIMF